MGRVLRLIAVATALSGFGALGLVGTSAEGFGHGVTSCGRVQIALPAGSQADGRPEHALSLLNRAGADGRIAATAGWDTGRVVDPSTNLCLALAPSPPAYVRLAVCVDDDPAQLWSWKAKWIGREAGQPLLVVRHSQNALVLEADPAGAGAGAPQSISARPFREDGSGQRFAVQGCEG